MPRILPLRSDTDGDGLPDADEVAGLSSGVPDLDLVPRESRFVGVLRPVPTERTTYQGNNVQKYMQCRPSLPTGIQSEP